VFNYRKIILLNWVGYVVEIFLCVKPNVLFLVLHIILYVLCNVASVQKLKYEFLKKASPNKHEVTKKW